MSDLLQEFARRYNLPDPNINARSAGQLARLQASGPLEGGGPNPTADIRQRLGEAPAGPLQKDLLEQQRELFRRQYAPKVQQSSSFLPEWDVTKETALRGDKMMEMGTLLGKASDLVHGAKSDEEKQQAMETYAFLSTLRDEYQKTYEKNPLESNSWLQKAVYGAAQSAIPMGRMAVQQLWKEALVDIGIGVGIAAVGTAIPEPATTIGGIATGGAKILQGTRAAAGIWGKVRAARAAWKTAEGASKALRAAQLATHFTVAANSAYEVFGKSAQGEMYHELTQKDGIDADIAYNVSKMYGHFNSAVEAVISPVDVLGNATQLPRAAKSILENAIKSNVKRAVVKFAIAAPVKTFGELTEEGAQAAGGDAARQIAAQRQAERAFAEEVIAGVDRDLNDPKNIAYDGMRTVREGWNGMKEAFWPVVGMGMFGLPVDTVAGVQQVRAAKDVNALQADRDYTQQIGADARAAAEGDFATEARLIREGIAPVRQARVATERSAAAAEQASRQAAQEAATQQEMDALKQAYTGVESEDELISMGQRLAAINERFNPEAKNKRKAIERALGLTDEDKIQKQVQRVEALVPVISEEAGKISDQYGLGGIEYLDAQGISLIKKEIAQKLVDQGVNKTDVSSAMNIVFAPAQTGETQQSALEKYSAELLPKQMAEGREKAERERQALKIEEINSLNQQLIDLRVQQTAALRAGDLNQGKLLSDQIGTLTAQIDELSAVEGTDELGFPTRKKTEAEENASLIEKQLGVDEERSRKEAQAKIKAEQEAILAAQSRDIQERKAILDASDKWAAKTSAEREDRANQERVAQEINNRWKTPASGKELDEIIEYFNQVIGRKVYDAKLKNGTKQNSRQQFIALVWGQQTEPKASIKRTKVDLMERRNASLEVAKELGIDNAERMTETELDKMIRAARPTKAAPDAPIISDAAQPPSQTADLQQSRDTMDEQQPAREAESVTEDAAPNVVISEDDANLLSVINENRTGTKAPGVASLVKLTGKSRIQIISSIQNLRTAGKLSKVGNANIIVGATTVQDERKAASAERQNSRNAQDQKTYNNLTENMPAGFERDALIQERNLVVEEGEVRTDGTKLFLIGEGVQADVPTRMVTEVEHKGREFVAVGEATPMSVVDIALMGNVVSISSKGKLNEFSKRKIDALSETLGGEILDSAMGDTAISEDLSRQGSLLAGAIDDQRLKMPKASYNDLRIAAEEQAIKDGNQEMIDIMERHDEIIAALREVGRDRLNRARRGARTFAAEDEANPSTNKNYATEDSLEETGEDAAAAISDEKPVEKKKKAKSEQKPKSKEEIKSELAQIDARIAEILSKPFSKLSKAEDQELTRLEADRDTMRGSRYQASISDGAPVSLDDTVSQVTNMAKRAGGTFTRNRTSSDEIGTMKLGRLTVSVIYGKTDRADAAGMLTSKGGNDFVMVVDRDNGMVTTVAHETAHLIRDVLFAPEKQAIREVMGLDLNDNAQEELFAQKMETAEGRAEIAVKLKDLSTSKQNVVIRAINKIIRTVNAIFGTEMNTIKGAEELLGESLSDFSILGQIRSTDDAKATDTRATPTTTGQIDDARYQKAKPKKEMSRDKAFDILEDRYGKNQVRAQWNAMGQPEGGFNKWLIKEASTNVRTGDPAIVSKIVSTADSFARPKTDALGRDKQESKARSVTAQALSQASRPWAPAEDIGVMDEWMKVSTKSTDAAGRLLDKFSKWNDNEMRDVGKRIAKAAPITLRVKIGGSLKGEGINSSSIKMTMPEALTYYMLNKRASEQQKAKPDSIQAKRLDHAMGRIVMSRSSGADPNKVFHVSKVDRAQFMRDMEANADVMRASERIQELMNDTYEEVNRQYTEMHGKALGRDAFYFHMTRDPAFIKKFAEANNVGSSMDNIFKAFEAGQSMVALDPENMSRLQTVNWSDAPLIIRDAFDEVQTHLQDSAKYLEASPAKNWIDTNILNPDVKLALGKTAKGRRILDYWKNTSDTLGGTIHKERTAMDRVVGAFMKNATPVRLANPLVWLKQPMSMIASVAYFGDAKYIPAMYGIRDRKFINQVLEKNGTLAGRRAGKTFDPNLPEWRGEGAGAAISGVYRSKLERAQATSARWVQKAMSSMDNVAIDGIIMAARKYVQDTQPNLTGDAFIEAVGEQAAMATKMTQVGTYGIDRTMMERTMQGPWEKMVTYMWGARGAQFNLLAHSMKNAFDKGDAASLRNAALVWLTAGMAQSAQVVLVDMLRGKGDEPPDEEDFNKAYSAGISIFESMAGTIPVLGTELVPALTAPIYKAIGDKKSASLRTFRLGKTGPLSGVATDTYKILSTVASFIEQADEVAPKTYKQRKAAEERKAKRLAAARQSLTRLGSEMFGIPVNQVERMIGYTGLTGSK